MAKTIAVWGSPRSGKTSFATKLARTIYDNYDCKVLCVYTDFETPSLPVLFPSFKAENLYSIGNALSQTDITQEGVVKQIVQLKDKMNIGFLGFKDGDNLHSYPQFDREKIQTMYSVIGTLADYVIIDCSSHIGNPLSRIALQMADTAIRLATPDLSCISWYVSQIPLYTASSFRLDKQIQGVNVPDEDLFMPIDDLKAHLPQVSFSIPYCKEVKQQMLDGKLLFGVGDKKYSDKLKAIAEKLI